MTTFSQLVDEMASEMVRPDFKGVIASYINQTVREVHTGADGTRFRFHDNRVELEIIVPDGYDDSYVWPISNYTMHQATETVWYDTVKKKASLRTPGKVNLAGSESFDKYYFYPSGPNLCFFGYGKSGALIKVSKLEYPRSLVYRRAQDNRWASYDAESMSWTYNTDLTVTEEEKQLRSTNWIIMRWTELIREGVRAKVYKRLGDQARMGPSYSAYQEARKAFELQESVNDEVEYFR